MEGRNKRQANVKKTFFLFRKAIVGFLSLSKAHNQLELASHGRPHVWGSPAFVASAQNAFKGVNCGSDCRYIFGS